MKIKKFNKKEKNPNHFHCISLSSLLGPCFDIISDLDLNVSMKETFGVCPLEIVNLIIKSRNTKI